MNRHARVLSVGTISMFVLLLLAGSAFGQATTGSIKGEVVDQADAPLAGVILTLQSDALQGQRSFETLEDGRFRFFALPSGKYELQVEKEGFKTILQRNLQVTIGGSVNLKFVMEVPELGETVEVIDRRPLVDTEATNNSMSLNADFLKDLPSARSFQDVVQFLPGVTGGANPNINGGTAQQNRYYLDGANTTDPVLGTFSMNFNFDAIEELEVITAGYDARYNQGLGGTINIVTKSGGNNFEGNFSGYLNTTGLSENGDDFVQTVRALETRVSANASLGGPIVRDRLWFFVAYQYTHRYSERSAVSTIGRDFAKFPLVPRIWNSHYILGKITAQPVSGHKFTLTVRGDPTTIDNVNALDGGADYSTAEDQTWWNQGGISGTLTHNAQLGGRGSLETSVIYQFSRVNTTPMNWQDCENWDNAGRCVDKERDTPAIWGSGGAVRGLDYGAGGAFQLSRRHNLQIKTDLTLGLDRLLGSHTVHAGAEVNPIWHDRTFGYTGNELLITTPTDLDGDGEISPGEFNNTDEYTNVDRYIIIDDEDSTTPGILVHGYLQDRWTPVRGLTINGGFRYVYSHLENNAGHAIIDNHAVSGGFGVAWDPFRDGKTRISVSYQSQAMTGLLETSGWINNNSFNFERYSWDESQRRWGEDSNRARSPVNSITHPDLVPTRNHEVYVALQREIARDLRAEANFIYRRQRHLWEDDEVNVLWNSGGTDAVGFRNGNGGTVTRLRTPEDSYRTYWALTMRVIKQLSDNFQMEGSYTYSRNVANATGRYSALDGQTTIGDSVLDRIGASADYDNPTQRWHERGLAENDRPHVLKMAAAYDNPGAFKFTEQFSMGYAVGGALVFSSGLPMNRKQHNAFSNNYSNYIMRRGSGERLPATLDLDLRGSLAFKIAGTQFDVIVQVFNVLNALETTRADERAVDSDGEIIENPLGSAYATPLQVQAPRRFELGLRFTF